MGFQNSVRVTRNHDLQAEREFRPPRLKVSDSLGNDSFSRPNGVFETLKAALTAWLRLGESAGFAERVEDVLEVPPGLVVEGDACHWRTNPLQSPTQSIDRCGVVQAVHLRSIGATAAAGDEVRLSALRTRNSAANSLIRASDRVYAPYALLAGRWSSAPRYSLLRVPAAADGVTARQARPA